MASNSNNNNDDDVSNMSKPAKGTTEKKKRKRPSKKVPTTVLQANSSGFMHLVQKLTGSAEELAGGQSHNNNNNNNNPSPYQSPYSSPSNQPPTSGYAYSGGAPYTTTAPAYSHEDVVVFQPDPYQQYHHREPESNNNYSGYSYVGGSGSHGEDDDHTYAYSAGREMDPGSSSRGMDPNNDVMSAFSWRDPSNHNSSSDYYCFNLARRRARAQQRRPHGGMHAVRSNNIRNS